MKFHEIDARGNVWVERVSSLPTPWDALYEGRILYAEDENGMYVGTDTRWERVDKARFHDASASYPSDPEAGMLFFKTDTGMWYMRNSTNTTWIALFNEARPPVDKNDGGTFDADKLDGQHASAFAATLSTGATTVLLLNGLGATLSTITVPYATNADTVDSLHKTSFGASLQISGQNLLLKNTDGTTLSTVAISNADTLDGYHAASFGAYFGVYATNYIGLYNPTGGLISYIIAPYAYNAGYASSAGNSDTVDGYHASSFITSASARLRIHGYYNTTAYDYAVNSTVNWQSGSLGYAYVDTFYRDMFYQEGGGPGSAT
jgi:hypothetical protein